MSASIGGYEVLTDSRGVRVVFYQVHHPHGETLKRYTDFTFLHSQLTFTYPAIILPPLPPKHSLTRLLAKPWGYTEDIDIISRRTRLLDHYLSKLMKIEYIRGSQLIDDFFNDHQQSPNLLNIKKNKQSILLISPNPLNINKMNPYLPQMPIPPASFLKSYQSNVSEFFKPIEFKVRTIWNSITKLEMIIKDLKKGIDGWRRELVELGGFLNIMSMMEIDFNQRTMIEQMGNKIDLTFLNIEVLTNSINKNVLEPILIIKYSIAEIVRVLHYRKLKETQLKYLSSRISKLQLKLKLLLDRLLQSRILKNSSSVVESPSLSRALKKFHIDDNSSPEESIVDSNPETVNIIRTLHEELESRQIPCYKSLKSDVEFVDVNVEQQANEELLYLIYLLNKVMNNWQHGWIQFTNSQIKVWGGG